MSASHPPTATRRPNSCLPCRESKSRCSGGIPCTACLKKRQKPRCVYRNLASKEAEAEELLEDTFSEQVESDVPSSTSHSETRIKEDPGYVDDDTLVIPLGEFFGSFSLSRTVDEYRQNSSSEGWIQDVVDSMLTAQALLGDPTDWQRITLSPSTRITPTVAVETNTPLLSVDVDPQLPKHIRYLYAKYLSVRQMLDTGLVIQAWTTFPSLVREVELYGLDQDHTAEERAPSHEITEASRRLWWHLLDLDLRLSLLVGRRPHLRPNAFEFPRPSFNDLRPDKKRLQQCISDFTQFKMKFLTFINTEKAQAIPGPEDRQSKQDALLKKFESLQERAPGLSEDGSKDITHSIAVAEHQFDMHVFSIVLHHHLARTTNSDSIQQAGRDKPATVQPKLSKSRNLRKQASDKTQKDMFQSARWVMELFDYIYTSDASRSTLSWTHCFGVYSAAVILGVARLRQDVDLPTDSSRIQHTFKVFQELTTTMPALNIAQLATGPLEKLATALENVEDDRDAPFRREPAQIKRSPKLSGRPETSSHANRNKRSRDVEPLDATSQRQVKARRLNASMYEDNQFQDDRTRFPAESPAFDGRGQNVPDCTVTSVHDHQYGQHGSSFRDTPMGSFEQSAQSFEQSFPPSASTSFAGNERMEYGSMEYGSAPDHGHHFHSNESWYHPPMSIHPPMYDALWESQGTSFTILGNDGLQHSFYHDPASGTSHPMDQQLHNQQSMMLNNMGHPNAPHVHDGLLKDNTVIPGGTHPSLGPESVQAQHDSRYYSAGEEAQYAAAQHPSSSPTLGPGLTPRDGNFAHPADSTRRRSIADIRQQQRGGWIVETAANYNELKPRGKGKLSNDQSRTPTQDGILSPLSEVGPQSRRNSATPKMIAQAGMPINLTQQLDFSLADYHPPMTLPMNTAHPDEYPGSRRASLAAHGLDVPINQVNANIPPQLNTILETTPAWQQGHAHATPVSQQPRFNTTNTMNYDLEMANNSAAYNAPFHQRHLLHHIHHDLRDPPRQTVTTGPYSNEPRFWGS